MNSSDTSVGGYFGLELSRGVTNYHRTPYLLRSGRASLALIILQRRPTKIYLPYYICRVVLNSLKCFGTPWQFYTIDEKFEIENALTLDAGEMVLYVDYFGVKANYILSLEDRFGDNLIVDATQSFFSRGSGRSWLFNSARKFFGVPDGSYLYVPKGVEIKEYSEYPINIDYTLDHLAKRYEGYPEYGYKMFLNNESKQDESILQMSNLSRALLSNVDYGNVVKSRCENYHMLDRALGCINELKIFLEPDLVPFMYPLLLKRPMPLEPLHSKGLYIPVLWPELRDEMPLEAEWEESLVTRMLPLPIDHRYSASDMKDVVRRIKALLGGML